MLKKILAVFLAVLTLASTTVTAYAIEETPSEQIQQIPENNAMAAIIISHEESSDDETVPSLNQSDDTLIVPVQEQDKSNLTENQDKPVTTENNDIEKTTEEKNSENNSLTKPSEEMAQEEISEEEIPQDEIKNDLDSDLDAAAEDEHSSIDDSEKDKSEDDKKDAPENTVIKESVESQEEPKSEAVTDNTPKETQNTQRQITIKNLNYDGDKKSLVFNFQSNDNTTQYTAHILGCTFGLDNESYHGGETIEVRLEKMATDLADQFYNGKSFAIKDSVSFGQQYGLIPQLIDAEKQNLNDSSNDDVLCWAASAADMLLFANWTLTNSETEKQMTVDDMYDFFVDDFYNRGSSQEVGVKWFIDGVNTVQEVDNNGNIEYVNYNNRWAQEKSTSDIGSWKGETWHGFYPEYSAENVITSYDRSQVDKFEEVTSELDKGNAVGFGVETLKNGVLAGGGHAITLFGYIKSLAETGLNALKAVFFADSDNNAQNYETKTADIKDKKDLIDSVTMYTVSPITYSTINGEIANSYNSLSINGYSETTTYVITDFSVLKNKNSVEVPADTGSKNAKQNVDMVMADFTVKNESGNVVTEAYSGDTLYLVPNFRNYSYSKIDYSKNPHLTGKVHVYRKGEDKEIETKDFDILLEDYGGKKEADLLPNKGLSYNIKHSFSSDGQYTFVIEITGIKNEDGTSVQEAYASNNLLTPALVLNVTSKPVDPTPAPYVPDNPVKPHNKDDDDDDYDDDDDDDDDEDDEDEEEEDMKVQEYTTSYVRSSIQPLSITLLAGDFEDIDISTLVVKHLGLVVDKANYTITKCDDGSYIITFTSEYMSKLASGEQELEFYDNDGDLVMIISIKVQ